VTMILGGCSKEFFDFSSGKWTDARVQRKDICSVYIYFPNSPNSKDVLLLAEIVPTDCEKLPKAYKKE